MRLLLYISLAPASMAVPVVPPSAGSGALTFSPPQPRPSSQGLFVLSHLCAGNWPGLCARRKVAQTPGPTGLGPCLCTAPAGPMSNFGPRSQRPSSSCGEADCCYGDDFHARPRWPTQTRPISGRSQCTPDFLGAQLKLSQRGVVIPRLSLGGSTSLVLTHTIAREH